MLNNPKFDILEILLMLQILKWSQQNPENLRKNCLQYLRIQI